MIDELYVYHAHTHTSCLEGGATYWTVCILKFELPLSPVFAGGGTGGEMMMGS